MEWGTLPWTELREEVANSPIVLLPIGATEAHGPHLPVATDVIISSEVARLAARRLDEWGNNVLILPPIAYTPAECAKEFAGTISVRPQTLYALLVDIGWSLKAQGAQGLVLVNSHLDPAHLSAISVAVESIRGQVELPCCAPSPISRRWGKRLGEEFRKGDCHAGRYETSLVLASRPELVLEEALKGLVPRWLGLAEKLKQGVTGFRAMGADDAYFGDPASGTAVEGRQLYEVLSEMIAFEAAQALPHVRWPDTWQPGGEPQE